MLVILFGETIPKITAKKNANRLSLRNAYAVNALIEKNLIEPCGKLDAPGRPTLYRTTTDFLRVFGLSHLDELPTVKLKTDTGETVEIVPETGSEEERSEDGES